MPGRIAERLAHEVQDLGAGLRTEPRVGCRVEVDIDVDEPAVADFLGECGEARDELAAVDRLRLQAVDEVPDVADREVDGLDRGIDAFGRFVGLLGHQLEDVLERQADRIERLDDPVVQVASDPVALLGDGQPPRLPVESRVVDRDPGVAGEELDERWSAGENSLAPILSVR